MAMGSNASPLEGDEEEKRWWRKFLDVEEAKKQVLFSIPMMLVNVSYYCIAMVSVMFAGHLGELELAGSTLGNSWATVTGFGLMVGLSGALETLCGQGFGAEQYRMLGIYLQASIVNSFLFSVIVSVLWFYSESILILLRQDPETAKMAGLFLRYLIPGIFAYGFLQCILRFLQTQNIVIPLLIFSLIPLLIHVGITYVLVHQTSLGFKGAALAAAISFWISLLMLSFYVKYSKKFRSTWEGFSLESLQYVLPNMKLAIPSALMVCLEYCAFEVLVILAGLMPNSENSTSLIAICVNISAVAFMITYGFSAAVSTRVSNELGAGNIDRAKKAVAVTVELSFVFSLAFVFTLALGHDIWASFFSNSQLIKKEFASMIALLSASLLLDSVQGVLSGVARGCGWQHLVAWTNLAAFYIVGMPISILLAFKVKLHAKGLWLGLICGLFCQVCILIVITLRTKWKKMELSVNDRV
ncbi:protein DETOXIFICATION 18-like [Tasmannia lanceolata]|uniref:protein DETOXIFICATION 18-like n=1 Tax=Tasmannia lanceolata TaxID=3420 RepID=UPI00406321DC